MRCRENIIDPTWQLPAPPHPMIVTENIVGRDSSPVHISPWWIDLFFIPFFWNATYLFPVLLYFSLLLWHPTTQQCFPHMIKTIWNKQRLSHDYAILRIFYASRWGRCSVTDTIRLKYRVMSRVRDPCIFICMQKPQHNVVNAFFSRSVMFLLRCSHVVLRCTTLLPRCSSLCHVFAT